MKSKKMIWISHLIIFFVFVFINLLLQKFKITDVLYRLLLSYLSAIVFTGIPSLIRRFRRKKTFFLSSLLAAIVFSLIFWLSSDFISDGIIISVILLILIILTVLQASLYQQCGLLYFISLKKGIEHLLPIKIISLAEYRKLAGLNNQPADTVTPENSELVEKPQEQKSLANTKLSEFIQSVLKKISAYSVNHKRILIRIAIGFGIFLILAGCTTITYKVVKDTIIANILDYSPKNETDLKAVIKVSYNSEVQFRNPKAPGDVFRIEPKISGIYQKQGNTIIFIPDNELTIATRYKVSVNTALLKAPNKKLIETKTFYFNTRLLEVANTHFYYDYEAGTLKIKRLVGEIRFSLPVVYDSLKERIEVSLSGKKLPYDIEHSYDPSQIYLSIREVEQGDDPQDIIVEIKKGIMATGGTEPLAKDYQKKVALKEKDRLKVESCDAYPVAGTSFIAIRFNYPLNEAEIKQHIAISPEIPFDIKAEYRFIVLEANFKVNTYYTIKINKELIAKNGLPLTKEYEKQVQVRDMAPYVRFTANGKILPQTDNLNVEFVSLNLDQVNLSIEKIYKNNLISLVKSGRMNYSNNDYYYDYYDSDRKVLETKTLAIEGGEVNQEEKNLINLKRVLNTKYQGLYTLSLSDPKQYYNYSRMLINITNIGLIIKNDYNDLMIYAVNILSLNPLSGIKITLISRENQILREGITDNNGRIIFKNYLATDEKLIPFLVLAEQGEDFTFLTLDNNRLDYSTFDTNGSNFNVNTYEAYAVTERGVYRPGDDVFSTVILRRSNLENPDKIPLLIKVNDPTGTTIYDKTLMMDEKGIGSLKIPTSYSHKTGEYSMHIYQDNRNVIGSTQFKIEEFIPHTIETAIELIEKKDQKIKFKVKANELHGAPSKGLKVKTEIRFMTREFKSKRYPDYRFYTELRNNFYQTRLDQGEDILDESGEKIYEIEIPASYSPPSALNAVVYADVFDTAGRPVSAALSLEIDKYPYYLGLKIEGKMPYKRDNRIEVKYTAVTPQDEDMTLQEIPIKIERKIWYSIFKRYGWKNQYTSDSYNEIVYDGKITIDKAGVWPFTPDKGGQYTVTLGRIDGMMASSTFYVNDDNYTYNRDLTDPYKLTMTPDKTAYAPGETAYVTILSPFDGKCLVSIERDRIYNTGLVDLSGGKAVVPVKITDDFIPNMYITAMAYRKPVYAQMNLPPVSYGAINLQLDKKKLVQPLEIGVNKTVRSSDGLKVDLFLPGGAFSNVVIACVDEGILQITDYKSPDPYDYFFRKRRLSVSTNTSLKDLLPDIAPYKKAFGGGDEGELDRRHLNPIQARRVKSVSLYSDILQCDKEGRISYQFKLPDFNGKLRVMALSANQKKFGSASSQVTVSDPIVLSPGVPRIMAPNDLANLPVRVFNKTGRTGKISVSLTVEGPLAIEGPAVNETEIQDNMEASLQFKVRAKNDAGVARIIFKADGNNETSKNETELAVRPASPQETWLQHGMIGKNKEESIALSQEYIEQGRFIRLAVSGNRMIRYIGALDYLIKYPYGCCEQITSSAFPLLYLKEYALYSEVFSQNKFLIDKYLNAAVKELESRLTPEGQFAVWPGSRMYYPWVSSYVMHFLIEAKKNGYPVSDQVYNQILIRLGINNETKGRLDRREENVGQYGNTPYTLFLKALIGKPDFDAMHLYYDQLHDKNKRNNLAETDLSLLAAAYALGGDKKIAKEFLPDDFLVKTTIRKLSGNFDSYIRNTALYLYAYSFIDSSNQLIDKLEDTFIKYLAKNGSFGSTQDTAWVLLALSAVNKDERQNLDLDLFIDGTLIRKLTRQTVLTTKDLNQGSKIVLKNNNDNRCYYNYLTSGILLNPDTRSVESGLVVNKTYYDLEGQKVDLAGVKKGTQILVSLDVSTKQKEPLENLVLVDLVPAGLEIENTRLASRGTYPNLPANNISLAYSDIRDDRIILFVDRFTSNLRYTYAARAVSSGEYIVPQFLAEVMYDPDIFGRSLGGKKLVVLEDEN